MALGPFSFFLGAQGNFLTLPGFFESCPDSTVPVVGPPGALMSICACSFHATCLGIFLIVRLGLGATCWLLLGVVCLCWAWSVYLKPCTRLPLAPMPSCACEIHVLCLKSILVACLVVGAFCCFKIMVAGCWLCHFGPCLAVGLPWGFLFAF